ncbi:non-ribosomal peptide synthetase, partial [Aquabacterium sp. CECT 9606]|uniref:non-ribosomal peptide synthetase n=1 Tax=Aquabacterium sp. CECT 9606 TaxID=2845822 RepID=UPI001E388014
MSRDEDQQLARRFAALKPASRRAFLARMQAAGLNFAELPIVRLESEPADDLPLSMAQRGLWLTWQLDQASPAYNMPGLLHLSGPLDEAALRRSMGDLARRHEVLRTVFVADAQGEPWQRILPDAEVVLSHSDLRPSPMAVREAMARQQAQAFAEQAFQLDAQAPWRAALFRIGDAEHLLAIVVHHIAADAWSLRILMDELLALYEAHALSQSPSLASLPIRYADYAVWQRNWMEAGEQDRQLAYWQASLGSLHPVLDLPLDRPREAMRHAPEGRLVQALPAELSAKLREVAKAQGTSLYMVMLALFGLTLNRLTGQTDIRIGSPTANRLRAETHGLVGYVANVQVLRAQMDTRLGFSDWLSQVRETVLGAQSHQDLPFDALVAALLPERQAGVHPLFQVKCTEQSAWPDVRLAAGLEVRLEELSGGRAHFDLSFDFVDSGQGIETTWAYAADLFEDASIDRMAALWVQLAQAAVRDPSCSLGDGFLPAVPVEDACLQGEAVAWADSHVLSLWQRSVARLPQTDAVRFEDQAWTYQQLDAQSERLAQRLRALGVGPEVRVGVHAPREGEFVLGLLAVLKAGGVFVPLDPQLPADRLAYQLADSGAGWLLSTQAPSWTPDVPVLALAFEHDIIDGEPAAPLRHQPHPDQAAYVIYTSGSTGRPKGVVVGHGALANYVQAVLARLALPGTVKSLAMVSTVAADLGHTSLFGALCSGRTLHLISAQRVFDPDAFAQYMHAHQVDVLKIVPSHLQALMQAARPEQVLPRHTLVVGGEATSWRLLDQIQALKPGCRVLNHYGPTETTVGVLTQAASEADRHATHLPLGRPLANVDAWVLDADLNPVPQGAAGELYLGGSALARGYQQRAGATAERFVPHPWQAGARLYRTGDRVRQLGQQGGLAFLGRVDDQVKVRGYRVELSEVASALRAQPGVHEAAVVLVQEDDGRSALAAYVVPQADQAAQPLDVVALKAGLAAVLPDYMVPSVIMVLAQLPLNANGKLDRQALPKPQAMAGDAHEAPQGEVEETLAAVWAEVLGRDQVSRHDNFFELGGDSILSLKVVARARKRGVHLLPKQLFESQSLSGLALSVSKPSAKAARSAEPLIARLDAQRRQAPMPLSSAQARQWFLWQLDPASSAYHVSGGLQLQGELNLDALRRAFQALVDRHESLRTVFRASADGLAEQWIQAVVALDVPLIDVSQADEAERTSLAQAQARQVNQTPFDLGNGPLLRVAVIRMDARTHLLAVAMHHIVSDGWSMQVIVDEFVALYRAHLAGQEASLPPLAIQYADYAAWQRQWLADGEKDRQLSYWKNQLESGLEDGEHPVLQLATDHPRQAQPVYRAAHHQQTLPVALVHDLQRRAHEQGATLFMALLAGWQALLQRYTGQDDIRVGVPVANRHRIETQGVVGFFVNTQVLRNLLHARMPLSQVLAQAKDAALGAQSNQDLPFEQLVEALQPERSLNHSPLFQVLLNHQRDQRGALAQVPGLTVQPWDLGEQAAQFELALHTTEDAQGGVHIMLSYARELFEPETIARLVGHYQAMLQALASQPDLPLGDVAWLSAPEQAVLGQWSVNRTHHADGTQVHHLIERQAARTPDAPALVFEQTTLSYGQLNRRANQLAHLLIGQGLQPEVLVGIAVERSIEMVVGLLAIMKAGGAYVPLDPEYPKDRLAYMMQDSGMGLLLTQSHVLPGLPVVETATGALRTWCLDTLDLSAEPDHDPCVPLHGDSLAYVIYTSGSTGRPKGAANRHRSLHNRLAWMQSAYALTPADTVLQKTPFSFDVSVWEFFWPLMVGARLAVARPGDHRDPDRLIGLIQRHGVSTLHFVPSMLQAFMAHQGVGVCTSLRRIVCSGEALPAELQNQVFSRLPGAGLYNLYGPTEAAIDVTHWTCRDDGLNHVAIGQPIADTTVRVLDAGLNLLPQGVAGELYLGGIGLARGYVGRHGLTAERFVADPFSTTGERLYRTGDLVRWRLDGQIEYLGRIDHQVKIRGFRIELGEIEAQLLRQAGVREAVVVVQPLAAGARLVAYVSGAQVLHTPGIKAQLALDLPDYMVPALIMVLDQLPLNANGKVDRKALPAPDVTGHDSEAEAPQGEAERVLAGIWSEVLSVQAIGRQDNFFELGGDSILSLQIVARARKAGWWITPRQMFERQRVADLAQVMQPVAAMTAAGQDAAQGEVPLLPIQCEFFGRAVPTRAHWNQALLLQTHLPLDTGLLAQALHALVQQHDGLRLRYRQEAGVWQQAYGAAALQPELLWIRQARDATELEALCDEAHRSLDLAHGPLMRALAVSMADGTNRLLLTAHHLVVDGVSWRVLVEDLHLAYGQLVAGQALSLPARTSSYQSWARRLLDSLPVHAADMPWWSKLADVPFSLPLAQAESPHGSRGQQASVTRQLDAVATQALLKDAPAAYRTQVNDLLLTALGRALCRWSGHERILIDLEGHGRENLHADIDLSRTVGWFTSLYPIELDALGEPGQALKRVKEHLRQVPHKGVGHGLLKHLGTVAQREALAALPKAQVVFNYLGQIDSGLDALADWTPASESLGTPMDPQAQPWHALSVSAQVAQGVLSLSMSYPASRVDAGTMSSLLDDCLSELHALITHCGSGAAGLTPSDVPLSGLNQHQLDALALPAVRVDDLYPLSPMQEGMLFHSVYEPSG